MPAAEQANYHFMPAINSVWATLHLGEQEQVGDLVGAGDHACLPYNQKQCLYCFCRAGTENFSVSPTSQTGDRTFY